MKKTFRSIISFVLIISLSLTTLPMSALAAEFETLRKVGFDRPTAVGKMNTVTYKKDPLLREPKKYYTDKEPEGELIAVNEYAKTYKLDENNFVTQIGGEANTYEDKKGNLQLVDNTLVEKNPWFSADYFENKANDYTVKLPVEITNKNGVTLSKNGYTVEFIPQGGDFSKPVVVDNAVLYNDVFDYVDYQYTVMGDSVKEDIVLNKEVDINEFSFVIKPGNLKVDEKNGAIILHENNEDEPLFTVAAPEMTDASGNFSTNLSLSLKKNGNTYIGIVTVDQDWLRAPERAYPVRIDPPITITGDSIGLYGVEQGAPNTIIGDNNYPYAGYDDGVKSGNLLSYGTAHLMTRTYVNVNYDFSQISSEAKIDSAALEIYHYTAFSNGSTNFGLYQVDQAWNPKKISWNYQKDFSHTFVQFCKANATKGWLSWDVREIVNGWVQGIEVNNGFVIKAEDERNMQCEVFHNKNGSNKPKLTINWSIPDPVDPNYPLNDVTINLRPITEKNVSGKLIFDAVFADGTATPGSTVKYWLNPESLNVSGSAYASASYKYPNSASFESMFPNGTKYKDKLGNWQTGLFSGLSYDTIYSVSANASKNSQSGSTNKSDEFLIYKIKQTDTIPYIANYYGVPLDTIMRDNRVQDSLVVENNTIFIRNPKTSTTYNPEPLTDDAKKAIDSALMGRGLHCEYGFEPINLNTGNFYFNTADVSILDLGGNFTIERTYNSKADGTNSLFGRNWSFAYDEHLSMRADGRIMYTVGDGKTLYFIPDGSGGYTSPSGYHYTLKKIAYTQGEDTLYRYEIHETDGSYKKFNAWGLLTDVIDAKGFETTVSYDENYKINSVTSPSGKVYGITTDSMGRISTVTLPNSSVLRYTYDTNGNLTAFTDSNGNIVKYVYDNNHRITAWYDQEGNRIILNEYDSEGRVIKQTDANGFVSTLKYSDNQTVATDGNGNVTKYTYDNLYRTTKIEFPDGKTENKTYDADNNLASDYNYTYTYDENGNKLTETRRDSAVRSYEYNEKNLVTKITDFDGNVTQMMYSGNDLTKITYSDGTSESYSYDTLHRVVSHIDANGNTETYKYNGIVATEYTDYNGNTYKFYYNSHNQLITTVAPDGSVTRKMYNSDGVQIGETAADGGYTEYILDKVGNVICTTNPLGYATEFVYDGMYNIVKGIDPQGNIVTYTYDANGNILTETDGEGNVIVYQYDGMSRLVEVKQANGAVTKYTYDLDGNLIKTENPDGSVKTSQYNKVLSLPVINTDEMGNETRFEYDALGNVQKITYADGTSLIYEYNARGRMIKFVDETGLVSSFSYDGNGNVLTLTENGSRKYTYEYDKNNNLVKTIDPLGGTAFYEYDALNNQIKVTNENGARTSYGYDAVGRVTKITDAVGNIQFITYDKNGNAVSAKSANGGETQYNYNELGKLISEKDAFGNITNYAYNKIEEINSVTDALGGTTSYTYDNVGNITAVTDALGYIATMEYDLMGNAVTVTLDSCNTSTFQYDKLGRVIKSTDAAGLEKSYEYDCMGRVVKTTDNTGAEISYIYDNVGRLLSQTDVIGRSESYEYDAFSQITSVTGTDGNKTTFAYDDLGRLVSLTDAENKTTDFKYDAIGNLISQTETDGKVYTYAYDLLSRVTSSTDPVGAVTEYVYDSESNLISVKDGNGITTSYAYDKLNRLTGATDGNGNTTTYGYDELSHLISLTEPEGGTTEYRYDAVGNLTKTKDANGYITEFVFDSNGNVTKSISQKGAEISYTYDKHNNLTSVTDALGNVTTYEVDLNGLTTKMKQANGGEYTYAYDAVNRITGITMPSGYSRTFIYDDLGNLSTETDNMDRTTSYEYDIMHRVTKVTDPNGAGTVYTYDASGNLSSVLEANGAITSYVYDILDRVTEQTDPEGKVTELQYDLVGNVTSVTKPGNRTTRYVYDNNYNLVSVTDPMGNESSQTYDKNNRITSTVNALGNTVSYEYDALDQVTKVTDASGAVVKYEYDAHGNMTAVTNPLGGKTTYTYDLADNLVKVTDPQLRETDYTYDSMHNLTSVTDADGKTTTYTYDLEGNFLSLTDGNGKTESMTYDLVGNLKSIVRPDSTVVSYDYDKLNNLVSKTYSEDSSSDVMYFYDAMGNHTSMTDETGESTYTYDILGRITTVTSADGKTVRYAYDSAGNLGAITYADGRVVYYTYDLNDRLIKVSDDGKETVYTYDAIGRVTETERPNGSKTEYTYDVRGNLAELVNKDADSAVLSSFEYTYNEQGYITEELATDNDGTVTRTYEYNPSGELVKFTEKDGLKVSSYTYTYDNSGNRVKLEKKGIEHPETITYEYDSAGLLISETSTLDGTTSYAYNENGSLVSETNGEKEITYEYTVEQRLSAVREGGALLMAASYDGDGNRVFQISRKEAEQYVEKADPSAAVDVALGEEDENSPSVGTTPSSGSDTDNPKNDASKLDDVSTGDEQTVHTYYEKVYDDPSDSVFWYGFGQSAVKFLGGINAAISSYLSNVFCRAWDAITGRYELVLHSEAINNDGYSQVDVEAMRNAGLTDEEIYEIVGGKIDIDGNVVFNTVETDASSAKTLDGGTAKANEQPTSGEGVVIPQNPDEKTRVDYELTYYVNNINTENTQVLMEYGKREELKNVYTYGNERISVETIADTFNPVTDDFETDYYLYDGRGSVVNVIAETADILESYTYDPFGNVTSGAPTFDSFYGYNAEETNPVTGMQYLRARYYDTEYGRFNVADTYLGDISQPLTLNRYSYTVNNPVMYIDSSGHFILTALVVGAVVGAVIGATTSGVKSYKTQKAKNGNVNGWTVAKDALVGGVIGGVVGAAAGVAGAAAAAGVAAVAGTGLAATALAGAVGGVAGGLVSRVGTKTLNSVASNVIQKNKLYSSAVYTETKTAKQILAEAWEEASDVKAMMSDAMTGAIFSVGVYGLKNLANSLRSVKSFSCGTAKNITSQNPIDDLTPKLAESINDIANNTDDTLNQVDDVLNNSDDVLDDMDDILSNSDNSGNKSDTLTRNRNQGRAFEQQEFAKFSSKNSNSVEQITIKTESGVRTRVDAIGIDSKGNVVINEFKSSSTAPLTNNQKIAFPEIMKSGGTVVGKGKGIFGSGYKIPAGTEVKIIRPN